MKRSHVLRCNNFLAFLLFGSFYFWKINPIEVCILLHFVTFIGICVQYTMTAFTFGVGTFVYYISKHFFHYFHSFFNIRFIYLVKPYKVNHIHRLKTISVGQRTCKICRTILLSQSTRLDSLSVLDYKAIYFLFPFPVKYSERGERL